MKKIVCILLFFASGVVYAQNLNKIWRELVKDIESENYEKALKNGLLADSILVEDYDSQMPDYAQLKRLIAMSYSGLGNNEKAENSYKEAIELFRDYEEMEDPDYASSLQEYGTMLLDREDYIGAEPFLSEALEIQKKINGTKSKEYAYILTMVGVLQYSTGKYSEAESSLKEAIGIYDKTSKGGYKSEYAYANESLALLYLDTEQYNLSISLLNEALKRYKETFGEKSTNYAQALAALGTVYFEISQFKSAEPLFLKALEIEKSIGGEESDDYTSYMCDLGNTYCETSEYNKAESIYRKALEIQESKGYDASLTYYALSVLYQLMSNFSSAEEMCLKALAKDEELFGKNSGNYLADLNILANNYTLLGNYDKALNIYLNIVEKGKAVFGEGSTDYAVYLDNLANLYVEIKKYDSAEPIILKAMEIKKKNLGEMSPHVAYCFDNLSYIYENRKDFTKAENYEKQAVEIYKTSLGEHHTDYGNSLKKLAAVYIREEKYAEAEKLLKIAINIFRNKVGENHPLYSNSIFNLAELYELTGRQDSAEILYLEVNNYLYYHICKNFTFLAEKEKEQFISDINSHFSDINSFVYRRKSENPAITCVAYNNQLALKGIVLQSSRAFRQAIMNSGNKNLIDRYDKFLSIKTLLSQQEQLPLAQRWINTDSLENISTTEEKELYKNLQQMPGFNEFTGLDTVITWKNVQQSLGEKEAAIEFIAFNKNNLTFSDETILYCALLIQPGMKQPEMIQLFEEEKLKDLLKENKSSDDAATANKLYGFTSSKSNQEISSNIKDNLYDLIWKPLESSLKNTETVYYSPVGMLNLISFDAIPCPDNKYLSDKYKMVAVTSTREVIRKNNEIFHSSGNLKVVFYGGINYDSDTSTMKAATSRYLSPDSAGKNRYMNNDPARGSSFAYLDGTLAEVKEIENILTRNKINTVSFTGDNATEESFKSFNNLNSPALLHIATHGFFFPEPVKMDKESEPKAIKSGSTIRSSDNPLLRAGLIFAGGNHAWKNQPLPQNVEDGILLASEVSEMYLPNTQLVVLSACETGLGEIRGTEGVFGMQRVFKMAGVNYMIISLWQVPDYQTSELMDKFYENWISGKKIHDSFRNAQNFMKEKYHNSPSAWAAFTLVE
ncbi:MAG: tetratricopeptide repeat protein [Bacteroidia bacterium]|nr:tetratricopeptide repeat protein [Bacteroidia bacterium]